jgi:hypothetical protein
LLRPLIGKWIDAHKKLLQPVDRSSVLLVVYSAFSAAVVGGVWSRVGPFDLAVLLAASAAILAAVIFVNGIAARAAGLAREDAIVLLTVDTAPAPSEKSLKSLGSFRGRGRHIVRVALHAGDEGWQTRRGVWCLPARWLA